MLLISCNLLYAKAIYIDLNAINSFTRMTNLSKLEFTALDITENNYLSWILDVEMPLNVMDLGTKYIISPMPPLVKYFSKRKGCLWYFSNMYNTS